MTTFIFYLPFLLLSALLGVYAERKVSAFMQDRVGPMEVGKWGLLQTLADILKLIQKEDIKPTVADKVLFVTAPIIVFIAVFAGFSVLPVNNSWAGSSAAVGVYYLLAIVSLDVVGVLMAGWGSNSKFSLYGALRSVAQIISYEIPLTLSVLCVVVLCQTLNLQEISFQQGIYFNEAQWLFGLPHLGIDISQVGGILSWNIVRMPLFFIVWVIYFIASLAESNRAPFDLPEAESELIGGFHTEYSGFRWSMFMLAEYGMMVLVSVLGAVLFWGSWNTPLPNIGPLKLAEWTGGAPGTWAGVLWGTFWLVLKVVITIFLQMWARWTYPRLRVDQLMSLSWKYLIPISLVLLLVTAIWRLLGV
jgi:NADH-quinone oxidoreductase subunit H